jgi:hypothetical protein
MKWEVSFFEWFLWFLWFFYCGLSQEGLLIFPARLRQRKLGDT